MDGKKCEILKKYPEKGLRNGGKERMGCGGGRGIEERRRWKRRKWRWCHKAAKAGGYLT